jgi:hypothetical protein
LLSACILAQGYGLAGNDGVDILGTGIFETDGSALEFPEFQDTNMDILNVGNDRALALGNIWQKTPVASAINNLEIKKNQDSGECACCRTIDNVSPCQDCCININLEQFKAGDREAMAFGSASASNYIKIVTNQQ